MYSSEPGFGGGGGGGKKQPAMEQEFNPFQTADEQQVWRSVDRRVLCCCTYLLVKGVLCWRRMITGSGSQHTRAACTVVDQYGRECHDAFDPVKKVA